MRKLQYGALPFCLIMTLGAAACEKPAPEPTPAAPSSAAVTSAAPSTAEREQVIAEATAVINPFKKQLSEALTGAMTQGGPLVAIDVCSEKAQSLAAQASTQKVTVGRSALKLRNPSNAPREWLKPILGELSALPSAVGAQRVVRVDAQHFGYAEAITLKPQCVTCHGTEVVAPVAEKIKERYPKDEATGFQPGQLRGVFWAEVALARAP